MTVIREVKTDAHRTHVLCVCKCKNKSQVVRPLYRLRYGSEKSLSCGCREKRYLKVGEAQIPEEMFDGIYPMSYERGRYEDETYPRTKRNIRSKVRKIILRRKWSEMMYNNSARKSDRKNTSVCSEWSDPETGFDHYYSYFSKLIPRRVSTNYQIRRIDPTESFSPTNTTVIILTKHTKSKPKSKKVSEKKEKLPTGITKKVNASNTVYQVRYKNVYLGSFRDLKKARRILSKHLKDTIGKSLSLLEMEKKYKKHPRYKLWYSLKYRSRKSIESDQPLMFSLWDHSRGIKGFVRFLKDCKKYGGKDYSFMLVRLETKYGYTPDNINWDS